MSELEAILRENAERRERERQEAEEASAIAERVVYPERVKRREAERSAKLDELRDLLKELGVEIPEAVKDDADEGEGEGA
ncbi:MAG: hypothetical protein WD651_06585 [Acidimicrobiia bacterium]